MSYPDIKKGLKAGCLGGVAACIFAMFTSIAFVQTRISMHQTEDEKQPGFYDSFLFIKNLPAPFLMKRVAFVFFIIGVPVGIAAAFRPNTPGNKQKLSATKAALEKLETETREE